MSNLVPLLMSLLSGELLHSEGFAKITAANWGDVPTWLSSVGSIFALAFAAIAAVVTRRTYRIESERDHVSEVNRKKVEEEHRRSQAALISGWWGRSDDSPLSSETGEWGAFARNASEAPVYQVYFTVLGRDEEIVPRKLHVPVLPPGAQPKFYPVPSDEAYQGPSATSESSDLRVQLSFTDSAGVRWRRDKYGRLFDLEPRLDIRVHDRFAEAMLPFVEDFRSAYGVEVKFNTSPFSTHRDLMSQSLDGEPGGVFIAPHDWCGELVDSGMVEYLTLTEDEHRMFSPWALEALTYKGHLWAVPATLDTIVLYTNTDLVPRPPDSLDELIRIGTALRDEGKVSEVLALQVGNHGDPYHLAPLFTSAGGWVFGRHEDGAWDLETIGVNSPESIAAYERIRSLGEQGQGILRREIDEPRSAELFMTGATAFLVSSSWGAARARAAAINFTVSPVPGFRDGRRPRPFVTVNGAFVSRRGRTKLIAHDFVPDYLSQPQMAKALADGLDAPAALQEIGMRDQNASALHAECLAGDPMPSSPQMRFIWEQLGLAEAAVIGGAPVEPVAHNLATAIRRGPSGCSCAAGECSCFTSRADQSLDTAGAHAISDCEIMLPTARREGGDQRDAPFGGETPVKRTQPPA